MRILKGYSKDEQKELEEAKDNGFLSTMTLIHGIGDDDDDCHSLSKKYYRENPNENEQMAKDIIDFYCGNAKFAEQEYVVHDKVIDRYIYFNKVEKSFYWSQLQARMPEIKTKEAWLNINPSYELRLERLKD